MAGNQDVNRSDRAAYWNRYYSGSDLPSMPSEFAKFVLNEKPGARAILDVGCGNGRDSTFFCAKGLVCVGIDWSESAAEQCKLMTVEKETANTELVIAKLQDKGLLGLVETALGLQQWQGELIVYARFLAHAITEIEEQVLFGLARAVLVNRQGCFALEFRTERDEQRQKVTPDHYRRYINPTRFIARAGRLGFEVEHFVEGVGLAKYKQDDAHVARMILNLVS